MMAEGAVAGPVALSRGFVRCSSLGVARSIATGHNRPLASNPEREPAHVHGFTPVLNRERLGKHAPTTPSSLPSSGF